MDVEHLCVGMYLMDVRKSGKLGVELVDLIVASNQSEHRNREVALLH